MAQERTVMFQLPDVLSGTLACIAGTVAGRSYELAAGTFVIGRIEESDLPLPTEPGVSKTHAKIVAEGDHYVLADCESRNGTIVNGSPVQRVVLKDGDEVRICGCVLRFTQRGGNTGSIKVRNHDVPKTNSGIDVDIDIGPSSPAAPASDTQRDVVAPPPRMPPDPYPTAYASAPPPAKGRVLATWYASGLVASLLFGGGLSAVLVLRASPADGKEKLAAATSPAPPIPAAPNPASAATTNPAAPTPPPPNPAPPTPATPPAPAVPAEDAKPAADADKPSKDTPPVEPVAPEKSPASSKSSSSSASSTSRNSGNGGNNSGNSSANSGGRRNNSGGSNAGAASSSSTGEGEGEGKAYGAVVEGGKSDAVRAKAGKVKSVEAHDGDDVKKGQVLVTFDEANGDEIQSLRDRIDSLSAAGDDEDAKRQLKEAKEKLQALQGKGGGPIVASMSGKLTGFNVNPGTVLRNGDSLGRIVEGEAPKRVRVQVDRNVKVKRGQSATMILKSGGEKPGTVSSVNGRTVIVETGDVSGDDVEAVKF